MSDGIFLSDGKAYGDIMKKRWKPKDGDEVNTVTEAMNPYSLKYDLEDVDEEDQKFCCEQLIAMIEGLT